jgi:hypothetical protein
LSQISFEQNKGKEGESLLFVGETQSSHSNWKIFFQVKVKANHSEVIENEIYDR